MNSNAVAAAPTATDAMAMMGLLIPPLVKKETITIMKAI